MEVPRTRYATCDVKTGVALRDESTDPNTQTCNDTVTNNLHWL